MANYRKYSKHHKGKPGRYEHPDVVSICWDSQPIAQELHLLNEEQPRKTRVAFGPNVKSILRSSCYSLRMVQAVQYPAK